MVVHLSAERGQTSSSFLVRRITDRSLGAAKESLRFRDVVSGSVGFDVSFDATRDRVVSAALSD